MAAKVYEGMFLLDSNRYAQNPQGVSGQITQMIEKFGGTVLVSRLWSEQRLAYPIDGHRKGTYWLTYFRLEGDQLSPLTRESELTENILRQMILAIDPRLVDTLVAHATVQSARPATSDVAPASVVAP